MWWKCRNIGNIALMSKVLPTSFRSITIFFIAFITTIIVNLLEFEKKWPPLLYLYVGPLTLLQYCQYLEILPYFKVQSNFWLWNKVKSINICNFPLMSKVLPTSISSITIFFIAKTFTPTIIFNLREFEKKWLPPPYTCR